MVKKNWNLQLIKIFFSSVLFSLIVLCLERTLGVGIDYHPDAENYLNSVDDTTIELFYNDPLNYVGSFYYVFVNFLKGNANLLIGFNIFLFAVTNSAMFNLVRKIYLNKGWLYYFSILIVIFDPYRAHLSTHVLKDTFIIFCLFFLCFSKNFIIASLLAVLGIFIRFSFFIYAPLLFCIKKISIKNVIFITIVISITINPIINLIVPWAAGGQDADMSFRYFDLVPNFMDYADGELIRTIVWPVIRITGAAALFSPVYLLFVCQSFALIYIVFVNRAYLKFIHLIFIFPLAVLAYSTTGYNSFLRYTQPAVTIFSILIACLPSLYIANNETKRLVK